MNPRPRHPSLGVAVFVAGLGLVTACAAPLKLAKDDSQIVLAHQSLHAPNPSQKGTFAVRMLYYGSGNDKQRAAFRDSVTIKTASIDGSKLASAPDPAQGKADTGNRLLSLMRKGFGGHQTVEKA